MLQIKCNKLLIFSFDYLLSRLQRQLFCYMRAKVDLTRRERYIQII